MLKGTINIIIMHFQIDRRLKFKALKIIEKRFKYFVAIFF